VSAEGVAVIPQCAECGEVWLPSDQSRWEAYLTDDEPPGSPSIARNVRSGSLATNSFVADAARAAAQSLRLPSAAFARPSHR
jgi:hypothetical protein